jgi:hypothetical protein
MSCSTRNNPAARRGHGCAAADNDAIGLGGQHHVHRIGAPPLQARGDHAHDVGVPDDLQIMTADRGGIVQGQHAAGRRVRLLQPAGVVHDEHAFDHPGEDGPGARAIAGEFLEPATQFLHRLVECAGDHTDLVRAAVADRARQVAGTVAAGGGRDGAHPSADPGGHRPGQSERGQHARGDAQQGQAADGGELRLDVAQRPGHPHDVDGLVHDR